MRADQRRHVLDLVPHDDQARRVALRMTRRLIDEDDRGEHSAHRRGVVDLALADEQVEHVDGDDLRAVVRTALRGDVDDVEELHRADDRVDEHEHQGRPQERQRDRPEALEAVGAVDARRVVDLGIDALQTGEEDQRAKAVIAPAADHVYRDQCGRRITEPGVRQHCRGRSMPRNWFSAPKVGL